MDRSDRLRRRSKTGRRVLRRGSHLLAGLPDGALQPDYSGIRPKIERPGGSGTDFLIQDQRAHGVAGLINLFGIESPGLTSSLAIADRVTRIVEETRPAK